MAIWQFSFHLYPRNFFNSEELKTRTISEERMDCGNFASDSEIGRFRDKIASVLPLGKSWRDSSLVFGNLEETCMEMSSENGRFSAPHIRLDLRTIGREFLETLLSMIRSEELSMVTGCAGSRKIIHSDEMEVFLHELAQSGAAKFCMDPRGYISYLTANPIDLD